MMKIKKTYLKRVLLITLAIVLMVPLAFSVNAEAASKKRKAAFKKEMKNHFRYDYCYACCCDLTRDGKKELVIKDLQYVHIYTYKKGKLESLQITDKYFYSGSNGYDFYYNSKKKILAVENFYGNTAGTNYHYFLFVKYKDGKIIRAKEPQIGGSLSGYKKISSKVTKKTVNKFIKKNLK